MIRNLAIMALTGRTIFAFQTTDWILPFTTTMDPDDGINCIFTIGQKTWDLGPLLINGTEDGMIKDKGYYTVAVDDYIGNSNTNTTFYFNICGDILSIPPECNSTDSEVCTEPMMQFGEESGFCEPGKKVNRPADTLTRGVAVYGDGTCVPMAGIEIAKLQMLLKLVILYMSTYTSTYIVRYIYRIYIIHTNQFGEFAFCLPLKLKQLETPRITSHFPSQTQLRRTMVDW